ncbi:hypothetical protein GCM10008018_67260 [Paenibacillus marchantiophytorum]|uniref:Uncharacterized protein n=1 Tax=Paenibacillus marchantiophytorum TaxID=1619310 RepID=A0ABQ1FGW4_9BACL|nr:hypothetical protein [Paenibacillus marchantiophytorum]GGA12838.1 hypothetical protein GCM10008018_67260 [Paenibacillus marchantiophytorum]
MSKKLEKNGLWESSRMMLPQHREALQNQRSNQPAPSNRPTAEDIGVMRDYVLLPLMHGMIKRKAGDIEKSTETLRTLYARAAHALAAQILADLTETKTKMMQRSIQLFEEHKDDRAIHYRYICRGHEDTLVIAKDYMRAEISVRTARYIEQFVALVNNARKIDERQIRS